MPKTLLVVDDSATMRKVFEMTLLGEEVTVVTHDGGDSLLARARDARPAAAIIDIKLAATTGYDACRALKSDAVIGNIPVLLLFSEQNPIDEASLKDAGAEGSISKPFESQSLIDRVKQLLSNSQSQIAAVAAPSPRNTTAMASPTPPAVAPAAPLSKAPTSAGSIGPSSQSPQQRAKATQMFAPNLTPPLPPVATAPTMLATPAQSAPVPPRAPVAPVASSLAEPEISLEIDDPAPPKSVVPPTAVIAPQVVIPPATVAQTAPVAAKPAAPVATPKPAAQVAPPVVSSISAEVEKRVEGLGLTPAQVEAVAALTREVVERVVWEVVPQLAETMIREEIRRLTAG